MQLGLESIGWAAARDFTFGALGAIALKQQSYLKRVLRISKNAQSGILARRLGQSVGTVLPNNTPNGFWDNLNHYQLEAGRFLKLGWKPSSIS